MCSFCEAIERWDWANEESGVCNQEYAVALVIKSWAKGKSKRTGGRITDYRYRGHGYKLNFCPECGKEMKGVKYGRKRSD